MPLICACIAAPPSSSCETSCPIALFTSAGPARYSPEPFGHQQLVAQHGQIAAAGDAVAHDRRILRNARRRDDGVVAKDAAEIVLVGKDILLQRQKDAGRIDEIDQRQPIGEGDPLGPQHLLGRHRKKRAGFHRGVVGDDHVPPAADRADRRHHARRRRAAPVGIHPVRRPQAQLQQRRAGIDELRDPLAGRQPPLGMLPLDRRRPAPQANLRLLIPDSSDKLDSVSGLFDGVLIHPAILSKLASLHQPHYTLAMNEVSQLLEAIQQGQPQAASPATSSI